jgi:membrane fusion protein, multidrug efflux system
MKAHRSVICTSLGVALVCAACKPQGPAGPAGGPGAMAVPVVVVEARRQPVSESLTLVGTLAANEAVEIKTETDGIVQDILFEEGQRVTNGQVLLRLDDTKLAATLAEADANLRLSTLTFDRAKQLFEDKLVSKQEYDQASATFDRTRASVDLMKRQLKDARLTAPFAGTVGSRQISPGQVISKATLLTTLVDLDPVKVDFYVPERFLSQVQTGQKIQITVAAYPGRKFTGDVYFVAPQLDEATRRAQMKSRIANPDGLLKPGMFANLELTLELRPNAIVIPEIGLMWDGDVARVFVVKTSPTNETVELRKVDLGVRSPGEVEITRGLDPGERIVTEGIQKVVPGGPVRVSAPAATNAVPAEPKAAAGVGRGN